MQNSSWVAQGTNRRLWMVRLLRSAAAAFAVTAVACAAQTQTQTQTQSQTQTQQSPQTPAAAQQPLSLKQAVDAAWARQPETRSLSQRRNAAAAQAQAARRWTPEPFALDLSIKTDRLSSNNGARDLVAGVSAPLWLPGERDRNVALANAEQGALDGRLAAAQWRTAGAVREAWWAAHVARIDVSMAQSRLASAQQLAADVARRVAAGDLARADQHQADAAVAAMQADVALTAAAQVQALQALRGLLGIKAGEVLALQNPVGENEPAGPVDALLAAHPGLRELVDKAEVARLAHDLALVQKRANPEVAVQTSRDRGAFGEAYGQSISIGVRFPFGANDRQLAKAALAGAERTEAETVLANERERLAAEAQAAAARVLGARGVVSATEQRAALARDSRGFFDKAFRLGQADLPTRLRIELEAAEAERQLARARIELFHAISALRQTLGLMPE